jgi:hypothetical protein
VIVSGSPPRVTAPYSGPAVEFASALAHLGIDPSPNSPLSGFVKPGDGGPVVSRFDGLLRTDQALPVALLTLAAPQRLLTYAAHRPDTTQRVLFLVGDFAVVGLTISDGSVSVSRPMSAVELAALIGSFVDPPANDERPGDLARADLLSTVAALLRDGLQNGEPVDIAERDAVAAVQAGLGLDCDPSAGLDALERDGVLTRVGSGFRLVTEWLERYAYLVDQDRVELTSIELSDVRAGLEASRDVSIVGAAGRQRVVLAAAPGVKHTLCLAPLTAPLLAAAVLALAGPPRLPRVISPDDAQDADVTPWFRQSTGAEEVGEWRVSAPDELVAALAGGDIKASAEAILRPDARVSVTVRRPGRAAAYRSVIAMTGLASVEWSMDGSRVRWRSLGCGGVDGALRDLLPQASETAEGEATEPVTLSSAEFSDLAAGALSGDRSSRLPASLRSLGASQVATWCAIYASSAIEGRGDAILLWIAYTEQGVIWRFHELADGFKAFTTEYEMVLTEIQAALVGREVIE